MKNIHGGVLILAKLQATCCTKINTPSWVFFTFFKLYKCYQIAQCYKTILCHQVALSVYWILRPIKMKVGQILIYFMANISNMFLAECWGLETSSRLFYDFIKSTIQQDLAIFNDWRITFLIVLYSPFQENKTLESWQIWLLSNWNRFLNKKGPGT